MSICLDFRFDVSHLRAVKLTIIMTESIRMVKCSALMKTLTKQYRNAASHRNHSRKAADRTNPMIQT